MNIQTILRILLSVIFAFILPSCLTLPVPDVGHATISRVGPPEYTYPGTRLEFRTNGQPIGNSQYQFEIVEDGVALVVFDSVLAPLPSNQK